MIKHMKKAHGKKLPAHQVKENLSKDVHAILSVCIQHFDGALRTTKEECFDVDAVIAGRAHGSDNTYARRVTPAVYSRSIERNAISSSELSRPQKGYFIPNAYASHLSFA